MNARPTRAELSEFERLAVAIARAVHLGPVDEIDAPPAMHSVKVNHDGTRIQLMRAYDIQRDEYQYRCLVLKPQVDDAA